MDDIPKENQQALAEMNWEERLQKARARRQEILRGGAPDAPKTEPEQSWSAPSQVEPAGDGIDAIEKLLFGEESVAEKAPKPVQEPKPAPVVVPAPVLETPVAAPVTRTPVPEDKDVNNRRRLAYVVFAFLAGFGVAAGLMTQLNQTASVQGPSETQTDLPSDSTSSAVEPEPTTGAATELVVAAVPAATPAAPPAPDYVVLEATLGAAPNQLSLPLKVQPWAIPPKAKLRVAALAQPKVDYVPSVGTAAKSPAPLIADAAPLGFDEGPDAAGTITVATAEPLAPESAGNLAAPGSNANWAVPITKLRQLASQPLFRVEPLSPRIEGIAVGEPSRPQPSLDIESADARPIDDVGATLFPTSLNLERLESETRGLFEPSGPGAAPIADNVPPNFVLPGADQLKVHLFAPGTVDTATIDALEAKFAELGVEVANVTRVGFRVSSTQIRFYDTGSQAAARILGARVDAVARDFTNSGASPAQGTLEVYIAGSGGSIAAASPNRQAAPQRRPQRSEADILREQVLSRLRAGPG